MKANLTARASIIIVAGVVCTGLLASAVPVPLKHGWDTSLRQRHEASAVHSSDRSASAPVLSNGLDTFSQSDHKMQATASLTQPEPALDGNALKRSDSEEIQPRGYTNAANDLFGVTNAEYGAVAHVTEEQLSGTVPSERITSSSLTGSQGASQSPPKQHSDADVVTKPSRVAGRLKKSIIRIRAEEDHGLTDQDLLALKSKTPNEVSALINRLRQRKKLLNKRFKKVKHSGDLKAIEEMHLQKARYSDNLSLIEAALGRRYPSMALDPVGAPKSESQRQKELLIANKAVSGAFKNDKMPDWYTKQIDAAMPGTAQLPHARHSSSPTASSNSFASSAASHSSYQAAHQAPPPNTQGSALPASSAEPQRQDSPPPWSPGTFDLSDIEDLS